MRKRTPPHSIVCCRRWRFAVHAVRLVLDCSKAIVGFLCARVNAVPVRSSPPIRLAMLTSAWRAARHRERERIKSDVGLAEEGKRIGRPTISRRLRERVAERIAAGRDAPSRVAKDIVLRRPSYFFMQRVNSHTQTNRSEPTMCVSGLPGAQSCKCSCEVTFSQPKPFFCDHGRHLCVPRTPSLLIT